MKKLLLLLCVPFLFSCGDGDTDNLQREITQEMIDDKYTGKGTYTWGEGESKGDKYVGEFKDGNMHVEGTYTWDNGNKYDGEWKNGKKNGKGTYTTADGDSYNIFTDKSNIPQVYHNWLKAEAAKIEERWNVSGVDPVNKTAMAMAYIQNSIENSESEIRNQI